MMKKVLLRIPVSLEWVWKFFNLILKIRLLRIIWVYMQGLLSLKMAKRYMLYINLGQNIMQINRQFMMKRQDLISLR